MFDFFCRDRTDDLGINSPHPKQLYEIWFQPINHLRTHLPRCHIFHTLLYSESLSRTYRVATSDPTWSCERSLCSDAMGRAAPSPSDPGCFSFLPVFGSVVFSPYFSFHVYSSSRCWLLCIWFAVLLRGAYSLDSLHVTLTFSLVCIPPSVPACWRTTYCPIEVCTFDAFPFPCISIASRCGI